jgi:Tfp pilus assembly protein PilE
MKRGAATRRFITEVEMSSALLSMPSWLRMPFDRPVGRRIMRILRRLEERGGQGVIEVFGVTALIGVLFAVAIPAYLTFQDRRADVAAKAHLKAALPAVAAYRTARHTYVGLDAVDLVRIDPRISYTLSVAWVRRRTYCLTETVRGKTWSMRGPQQATTRFSATPRCG